MLCEYDTCQLLNKEFNIFRQEAQNGQRSLSFIAQNTTRIVLHIRGFIHDLSSINFLRIENYLTVK
jgi:hypothetical protein